MGLTEEDVETLCLAATELLANAVEHAQPTLHLTLFVDRGCWTLQADGVGPLHAVADELIDRRALLSGLGRISVDDRGRVELSAAE
jgi:two-component sensor histidine kinase